MNQYPERRPRSSRGQGLVQGTGPLAPILRISLQVFALALTSLLVMLVLGHLTPFHPGYVETAGYVGAAQLVYVMLLFTRALFFSEVT
ncbi:Uncharacterised protein (plasmid) [Tsukamurella tyrosinosolvens]|uniref:Uncharacterized protein n=1 Tax=Tsukamurella tyrosinosolvens TaxID=57704 RepID=A0A1H4VA70_TSUTY|nr:hypothetical protein [Tsukamurella tyrosinosolvens]SEC78012.1 hypothetical protein SAMN04489793_3184 [Tsukamurella tyrosinosolvens]VEH90606.1 Uncharacterised protein [Tsukamurella tyrosinosolvens]